MLKWFSSSLVAEKRTPFPYRVRDGRHTQVKPKVLVLIMGIFMMRTKLTAKDCVSNWKIRKKSIGFKENPVDFESAAFSGQGRKN
jgi:hypothetical protein